CGLASYETESFALNSDTINGPVPIGVKLASVHSGAFAPRQSANCAAWIIGTWDPTKGTYGYGFGTLNVTLTVSGSTASTFATSANFADAWQPPPGATQ